MRRRRPRAYSRGLFACGLGAILVAAATIGLVRGSTRDGTNRPGAGPASAPAARSSPSDALSRAIQSNQVHLQAQPNDWQAWAELGFGYVQRARVTVDPSYYPKAEGAIHRSFALHPRGNLTATIAMGTLAAARHDFAGALDDARRALALDSGSAAAYGVLDDALTQLGRYPEASAAVQRMLDLQPGLASFARASYDFEEHGDVGDARTALERAVADASSASDAAFGHYYLGELAFNNGDLSSAATEYADARTADPTAVAAIEGMAKVEAARGETDAAIRDYRDAIDRVPQPAYVLELGELEQSLGRTSDAERDYALLATEERLFAANGVNVDLELTLFDADHGSSADAVTHGAATWTRQHSALAADAMAWALHAAGRDDEGLAYANGALRLGWRNALLYAHRGFIEATLGQKAQARADLQHALDINPAFSVLLAARARQTLAGMAT